MPADTLSEMILGFAVIFGVLAVYILTLVVRLRRERRKNKRLMEDQPDS